METRTHRVPGMALLVVIGAVIVAAVAGVALVGPPRIVKYEPGSPEAAAQAYVQALFEGDYDLAYRILSPQLQEDCRSYELQMGYEGQDASAVLFEEVRTRGDRVTIEIRLTGTQFEPGPFPINQQEIDTRRVLERQNGEWRIVAADWPLYGCARR